MSGIPDCQLPKIIYLKNNKISNKNKIHDWNPLYQLNPFISKSEKLITPFAYDYNEGKIGTEIKNIMNWENQTIIHKPLKSKPI